MGEAARKRKVLEAWRDGLDRDERIVFDTARALYEKFRPTAGSCYRMTFTLRYFLAREMGIEGDAVVGFVNDGTDELYASHAWFIYRERKTDIALAAPQHPELQPAGPVIIHGFRAKDGHDYSYHLTRPPEGESALEALLSAPVVRESIEANEALHAAMAERAGSDDAIRAYLDAAPDRITYEVIATVLRKAVK